MVSPSNFRSGSEGAAWFRIEQPDVTRTCHTQGLTFIGLLQHELQSALEWAYLLFGGNLANATESAWIRDLDGNVIPQNSVRVTGRIDRSTLQALGAAVRNELLNAYGHDMGGARERAMLAQLTFDIRGMRISQTVVRCAIWLLIHRPIREQRSGPWNAAFPQGAEDLLLSQVTLPPTAILPAFNEYPHVPRTTVNLQCQSYDGT